MTLSSTNETCNGNDGTVMASIMDCEMTAAMTPDLQNFLNVIAYAIPFDPFAWEVCVDSGYCGMLTYSMMEAYYALGGMYIDFWMLGYQLQDLANNVTNSELQDFLNILAFAIAYDPFAWEVCVDDGYCLMVEYSMMEAYYALGGMDIDFWMLGDQLQDLANNSSESACTVTWTNENGDIIGDGMEISGLSAGSYTATMTHTNGCTSTQTVDVGSSTNVDECGVCDGDNSTCLDECGVPNGDNSTCLDECGVPNGDNTTCLDECGVPNGDNSTCLDACGVPNGDNTTCLDECGVPNGDNTTCLDECGIPNGDNSTCLDACGVPNGDNSTCLDECGVPNGDNTTCLDECGVPNGDNTTCVDECGVPNGDNTTCLDECGVVNGDNSLCTDDCGIINGDNSSCADDCGVPNGDNSSCSGCTNLVAYNYDSTATIDDGSCEYGPWDVNQWTDCNMTILIPSDASITIDGESISNGDWIGVFYMNENGEMICSGSTMWTGETTSIAAWGAESSLDNGFQYGENLTWGVFDSESETLILGAQVSYSFGSNFYSCNGLTGIESVTANSSYSQSINLPQGWSLWSTYIDPADSSIGSVFNSIESDLIIVKDQEGNVYWPQFGLNSIGALTIGQGYQTKMNSSSTLSIEGNLVPFDSNISLNTGWNIMGYLHQEPYSVIDMMSSVNSANLIIMKDQSGNVYWPQFGLNSIGNMNPGQGYQIKLAGSWNFTYPAFGGLARYGDVYTERPVHFEEPSNTGNNMIIGLPLNAWESTPSIGDEIAAYGEDGELIGSTTFQGDHIALTVWGDDLTTDKKDGISEGESISFKLWNSQTGVEQTLEVRWSEGVGFYTTDGISIAGQIILGSELATDKQLVRITDMLGRDVNGDEKDVMLLYIYDDGSIERVYIKE